MDDYLTKPLRPKALEGVLARWVGGGQKKEQTESAVSPSLRPNAATPSQRVSPERGFEGCSDGLLRLFLEQVPAQLELLDGAMAGGDVDDVRAHAHKLKGSMLTLEATELGELAQSLQHDAERGDLSHSDATLASLTSGFFALEKRVKSWLSRRKKLSPERSSHG
jgi:HPt (histidine-containing phosphotransfer) domain-containing protein